MNFANELSIRLPTGWAVEAIAGTAAEPPLNNAAAPVIPNNAAIEGITIPHIAPVDNPLLLFL